MAALTLVPTRRNKNRKAVPVTGTRIGVTDDWFVIRRDGEDMNLVLSAREWRVVS
jgi:hypothetical protein